MVVDTIENAHLYKDLGDKIKRAFEYLEATDFELLASGKYNVDGEDILRSLISTKQKTRATVNRKHTAGTSTYNT